MSCYPLLFDYKDLIAGNGFLAGVLSGGRAFLIEDADGIWMHGVTPGGISADGESQKEATAEFRSAYRAALYDIAAEAVDFLHLQKAVEEFFADENTVYKTAWQDAVEKVRNGSITSNWLKKRSADSGRGVQIFHVREKDGHGPSEAPAKPTLNALDSALLAA